MRAVKQNAKVKLVAAIVKNLPRAFSCGDILMVFSGSNMGFCTLDFVRNNLLIVDYREFATNAQIVQELEKKISNINLPGGEALKILGILPTAATFVIAEKVLPHYETVMVFDCKLLGHIVVASRNPRYQVGELIAAHEWVVVSDSGTHKSLVGSGFKDLSEAHDFIAACNSEGNKYATLA